MTTENAPPTKPRGPRRWPWVVVLLLLLTVGYVGGYVNARRTGRIYEFEFTVGLCRPDTRRLTVGFGDLFERVPSMDFYRPCIAVEEWWLNR